jgi:hypothetical protein
MVGIGWGFGRGYFNDNDETQRIYRNGAVPQMRIGRMAGQHMMIDIFYEGWVVEFGEPPAKIRRGLQNFGLGFAWFPGNPEGASGGFYLRGGLGIGWTGITLVPVEEEEKQTHGERIDEWGTGFLAESGYEFWVTRNFAAGLSASLNYIDLGRDLVDSAWFASGNLTLTLYF